jgi:PAS domain S-box-containing protein
MKLQTKILLIISSLTLLLGAPLLLTVKSTVHHVLMDAAARHGILLIQDLAEKALPGMQQNSEALLLPALQSAQEASGASYVMALNPAGQVLAHTNVAEKGKTYRDAEALADMNASSPRFQSIRYNGNEVMDVAAPVWSASQADSSENFLLLGKSSETEKKRIGTIRLALPLKESIDIEFRLFRRITWTVLIAGGIGLVLLLWSMRTMLRPIPLLSLAASRIGRGEYGVSVSVRSKDELGTLAEDFNRMSQALSETTVSKDFLSNVLANLVDPLIVMGPDTSIRILNPAAARLLGYDQSEVLGKPLSIFCSAQDNPLTTVENAVNLKKGTLQNLEMNFVSHAGMNIPVLFSSAIVKDAGDNVTHIIVVAKDMTERKKLETQLLQTGKLSAVGQLAGGVAHEINNPLGVILGFAQGVIRRLPAGDALEMPIKAIEREAIRCKNLVQDLLTFSRTSRVEREPMDINTAIEGALSLVMAQARIGQIEVKKELGQSLPRILGNPNQIQQIIINLANNALDAMGKQGTLLLRTESVKEGPRSWVCLYVTDTGPGIPPEIMSRIFEPFFTTKPLGQGTGLGLGLVHEIVQKHSATIEVDSRPSHTEFCVKFPARTSLPYRESSLNR